MTGLDFMHIPEYDTIEDESVGERAGRKLVASCRFFSHEGMNMKSATDMANNWTQAMGAPQTANKYKAGIQSTQTNPMAAAASADAQARYAANTAAAVSSGRMAAKLNAVPFQTWKDNATNVGAQRFASGATKAAAKVQRHFQAWAPIYQQMSDAAKSLPKGGLANALARVQAAISVAMNAAGKTS